MSKSFLVTVLRRPNSPVMNRGVLVGRRKLYPGQSTIVGPGLYKSVAGYINKLASDGILSLAEVSDQRAEDEVTPPTAPAAEQSVVEEVSADVDTPASNAEEAVAAPVDVAPAESTGSATAEATVEPVVAPAEEPVVELPVLATQAKEAEPDDTAIVSGDGATMQVSSSGFIASAPASASGKSKPPKVLTPKKF